MADEIRAAAASGNQEAIGMLKTVEFREERWARWKAVNLSRVEQLPDIDGPVVIARIDIGPELELRLNDHLVHREPGFYETIEPLKRIVPLLRTKYGERLKRIDTSGANDYLWGDRFGSIAEGTEILKESGFDSQGVPFEEGSLRDDQL
jgi:hypothetical protein